MHVGVLVALRALMIVARRVGVGVAWDLVKRPGGFRSTSLSPPPELPRIDGSDNDDLMQERYFASKVMEEKCLAFLFYGTDCLFHGREVRSLAVLWKIMYHLWNIMYVLWKRMYLYGRECIIYGRECIFSGRESMFYGRECIIYGREYKIFLFMEINLIKCTFQGKQKYEPSIMMANTKKQ
jgi:hypothetical protein